MNKSIYGIRNTIDINNKNEETEQMTEKNSIREMMYPLEWYFRFMILALVAFIIANMSGPVEIHFMIIFYVCELGALLSFIVQIMGIYTYFRDRKKTEAKV